MKTLAPSTVTYDLVRLVVVGVLSLALMVGCFWVMLAPTNQSTTNAASALLGVVISAWATRLGSKP